MTRTARKENVMRNTVPVVRGYSSAFVLVAESGMVRIGLGSNTKTISLNDSGPEQPATFREDRKICIERIRL
jgi:hypothetical protein